MTEQQFQLETIGQIAVPVTKIDAAVCFYRDVLGIKFLFQVPNLAFFDCGGIRLMLDLPGDSAERRSSVIYFQVADIQRS